MSKFFGPIVQQGYVVPDIHLGIRHWLKRGIGPFFLEKLQNYPAEVDGHSVLAICPLLLRILETSKLRLFKPRTTQIRCIESILNGTLRAACSILGFGQTTSLIKLLSSMSLNQDF